EVAAVDLLDVKGSAKVFEVNASPAIGPMEAATGVDVATRIIERAERLASERAAVPERVTASRRASLKDGGLHTSKVSTAPEESR
ncbi:MAG TPA: hypothetical protein VE549_11380, partial [Myxococcaceae bacterium]|nr:hypothetical protein [Myxococcaceae bacterium]